MHIGAQKTESNTYNLAHSNTVAKVDVPGEKIRIIGEYRISKGCNAFIEKGLGRITNPILFIGLVDKGCSGGINHVQNQLCIGNRFGRNVRWKSIEDGRWSWGSG